MINPETLLKFQQKFKELQIHAGLGVTEQNIDRLRLIGEDLSLALDEIYLEINPAKFPDIAITENKIIKQIPKK